MKLNSVRILELNMAKRKTSYVLLFICGFVLSSVFVCSVEFIVCDKSMSNFFYSNDKIYPASHYISSGLQQVVPFHIGGTKHYISNTFDLSGLGNLMFQYASLVGIAMESNMIPVIPKDCKLNEIFQLEVSKWNSSRPGAEWGKVVEQRAATFDVVLSKLYIDDDVELVGYLQSWMYFNKSQDTIRKHFSFNKAIMEKVDIFFKLQTQKILKNVVNTNIVYVGVHIRRGDMLRKDHVDYGYTVADANYLKRAMFFYDRKFRMKTTVFVVCSDDIKWAKANFPPSSHHVIYSQGNADYLDLAILSHCNHSIITTGTFGWWAGWLAGGHVTYYRDYPRINSRLQRSFSADKKDYYMPGWIGL